MKDIAKAVEHHQKVLGYVLTSEIVFDPLQKVRVAMLRHPEHDEVGLELVEPAADDAPVVNHLKKNVHLYQIAYEVPNVEETLARARANGAIIISHPKPSVLFGGRRIAFIFTPDGYIVEFVENPELPRES